MIQGGSRRRLKEMQERTDGQREEDILNGITSVAEQGSHLTTIQSQPRTDGNLGGEYVQAGRSSNTVPEPPASCPDSDLNTPTQLVYGTHTHAHTRTHTYALTELTLRLGVWVWSTVNLMRIVNCRSFGKDSL